MFNSVIFWVCKGVFRNLSDLQFIQQEVCSLLRVLYILDWTVWGFELLAGHLELKKRGFFAGWPVKKDLIQLQEEPAGCHSGWWQKCTRLFSGKEAHFFIISTGSPHVT